MLGSVPIQVVGSVKSNEFLYSSPKHPGLAISGHHLNILDDKSYAFIGVALSSRKTNDEKSVRILSICFIVQFCSVFTYIQSTLS